MNARKIASAIFLILLLGFAGRGNTEPPDWNAMFPDIPGLEKIMWQCDEGATVTVLYSKTNEWWRSVTVTDIKIFAVESKTGGAVRYFTALHGEAKLHEVPDEQYRSDLAFASPNYAKRLRGEPNDCVRL